MACNVHKGFLFSLVCPRLLCDLIHLENEFPLFKKKTQKETLQLLSFAALPYFPSFPAVGSKRLAVMFRFPSSDLYAHPCKQACTLSNKEKWNVEMSLFSRAPKAFWRSPRADLSLQPSKRRWGLTHWYLFPHRWRLQQMDIILTLVY